MKKILSQQLADAAVFCVRVVVLVSLIASQFFGVVRSVFATGSSPVIEGGASSVSVNMNANSDPTAFSLTLHATGDMLTWSISSDPSNGTADVSVPDTGNSQAISYEPDLDYVGIDSFVVQVSDGNGRTDTITVNVDVYYPPNIWAYVDDNGIDVSDMFYGSSIHLTINGTDYVNDTMSADWCDSANPTPDYDTCAYFDLGSTYTLKAGDIIAATGGGGTVTMTVADIQIIDIDVEDDTISGTADVAVGTKLRVRVTSEGEVIVDTVADAYGNWIADFQLAKNFAGNPNPYQLKPGDRGIVRDLVDNSTRRNWSILNPNFQVRANDDQIEGWDWPVGEHVTVVVTRGGTVMEDCLATVQDGSPWGDPRSYFSCYFTGTDDFDIQPGDLVSVTGATATKTTIVTPLEFTEIHLVTDSVIPKRNTVKGKANIGADVHVWVCDDSNNCNFNRHTVADASGVWEVNFATEGPDVDEKTTIDLVRGIWIDSSEEELEPGRDGDGTMYGINVANPHIRASAQNNWIQAREWPTGTVMKLEIDDASDGVVGDVDYTTTATVEQNPYNSGNDIRAEFDISVAALPNYPSGYTLKAEDVLTVSENVAPSVTKVLIVSTLNVTSFDVDLNTVTGDATAGVDVEVCVNIPDKNCISRTETATGGNWTVDFDPDHDLKPGDEGWAAEYDADSDRTWYDWRISNPYIQANPGSDWVQAFDWPVGTLLTLTINDNYAGHLHATVVTDSWGNVLAQFNDLDGYDLKPNDKLFVTDGLTIPTERTYYPTNLAVTGFNLDTHTVSGIGTPGVEVQVCLSIPGNCISRFVTPPLDGTWTVTYTGVGNQDLVAGSNGWLAQPHHRENQTWADWSVILLTFNSNGGTAVGDIAQSLGTSVSAPIAPTKTGYTFGGWYTDNDTFADAYIFPHTMDLSATLYAKWSINSYTVTYNGNGNTGGSVPVDVSSPYAFGSTVTALGNTGLLVKTGSTFDGWNTQADGLGISYAPAATFAMGAANVTLYAKWSAITGVFDPSWVGSVSITANKKVVAVGRPHIGNEVASYSGFSAGALTAYVPMLFKNAYGGAYDSALYVQNVDASVTANVTIKYYNSATGALTCTDTDTITPLSSKGYWLPTLSATECLPSGLPVGWVGSAVITSSTTAKIVANGRPHIGAEVMTYDSFSSGSQTSYLPMLFNGAFGGDYNSAFYVQNVSPSATAAVTIKYYDSATGALTCTDTASILPNTSTGYWLPTAECLFGTSTTPAPLTTDWVGGVVVTSVGAPIVSVGRPHVGSQITTYNGFAAGGLSSYVPMLFRKAFDGGTYDSALYVQNVDSSATAAITIKYYKTDGTLTCTDTDTIAPLSSKGYWLPTLPATECTGGGLPDGWVGGVVVTSIGADIVAIGRPHIGAQVTTYNGFSSGSTNSYLPMLFKNMWETFNSAFYVQNTDAAEATVTVRFYDTDGKLACVRSDKIPALSVLGYWLPSVTCEP